MNKPVRVAAGEPSATLLLSEFMVEEYDFHGRKA